MIYYRAPASARLSSLSLMQARCITVSALLAYPLGGFLRLSGTTGAQSDTASIGGFGLMIMALIAAATLLGSRYQRIIAEQPGLLDEWEIALRSRAIGSAYSAFSTLTLFGIAYCGIVTSTGGWLPTTYEEYNALFWGFFLYAVILPTAILVWQIHAHDDVATGGDR